MRRDSDNKTVIYHGIPNQGLLMVLITLVISFILHFTWYFEMRNLSVRGSSTTEGDRKKNFKVQVRNKPSAALKDEAKKILETPLEKTEAPEDARYRGAQDHKTDKETKVKKLDGMVRGADPGINTPERTSKTKVASQVKRENKEIPNPLLDNAGKVGVVRRPGNRYEALMPTSADLHSESAAGYQDYVDEDLAEGSKIDLNTSDYRFIGYFISLRKAFELVWLYPPQAVRSGMQGVVRLEFTILKDGSVRAIRVVSSSGYEILDQAAIRAIKEAAPYSPLPDGLSKDKLMITGNFRYILSGYAGG